MSLNRINLTNIDYDVANEFREEATRRKILYSALFEEMWKVYQENKQQ